MLDVSTIVGGFSVGAMVGATRVGKGSLVPPLISSLPGIALGARLTRAVPEGWIRALPCASLVAASLKVIH